MAAPGAAGIAAIIRQYFIDAEGTYWSAICNQNYASCYPFGSGPSGVLVKAILLHSGNVFGLYIFFYIIPFSHVYYSGSAMLAINKSDGTHQPIPPPPSFDQVMSCFVNQCKVLIF
jgi:hypothetical protein